MWSNTTGGGNVALGYQTATYGSTADFCCNVFLGQLSGHFSGCLGTTVTDSTAVGFRTLMCLTGGGQNNIAIGSRAGEQQQSGSRNVIVGPGVNALSITGSCQLAIGFASGQNWLTGDSSKNIKPGAGILDCTDSLGTAGQVLTSTGTALQWASSTKQYMSAYGCLTCTIGGVTAAKVNNWGVSSSSGIAIANNGDFTLTNGKKYLITVTLQPQVVTAGGQVTWGVYCTTPAFTQISPTQGHSIPTSNTSNNASESVLTFVYVPTATMQMSVCLSPAPSATYFTGYNNLTIVEI
jgi:hypothetical protein